jgi:hypothetical protein
MKAIERTQTSVRKPHYQFGPISIVVGNFLLARRRAGECTVVGLEAVHERFPGLTFYDFLGGFIFADVVERAPETMVILPEHRGQYDR